MAAPPLRKRRTNSINIELIPSMRTRKLSKFGIEIVDSCKIFDRINFVDLYQLLASERLILFRNQNLGEENLIEFCENFGNLAQTNAYFTHPKYREIIVVTNEENENGRQGLFPDKELNWHSAGADREAPERCIALYCIRPGENSVTSFADCKLAYDDLAPSLKDKLNEVFCLHGYHGSDATSWLTPTEREYFFQRNPVAKPLVRPHPISGELGLYFPFATVQNYEPKILVDGLDLMEFLQLHVTQEKYIYHHHWEPGDFLLNDQVHTIHRRDPVVGKRRLNRLAFDYSKIHGQSQEL